MATLCIKNAYFSAKPIESACLLSSDFRSENPLTQTRTFHTQNRCKTFDQKLEETEKIEIRNDSFEISANEKDAVIIQRHFAKHTKMDLEIQNLPIPKKPIWLNLVVRMLRFYQNNISEKLGNRCVFDPSCSRYSELAFREKGFFNGLKLTINRLKRCRPENGGIDKLN